jgi:putative hydrolase of HD superfamily
LARAHPHPTMNPLNKLLNFIHFTHLTHKVERVARTPGTERPGTVVEHSYQLAMLAWFLIDEEKLQLDKDLVLKFALIHDLVETYAGDTYLYDEKARETKEKREQEAQARMRSEFPSWEELHTLIEQYEKRSTKEAVFVYALDKLIDPLNIFLEDGKLWHEKNVTLSMLIEKKQSKTSLDPTVKKYFGLLLEELKTHEKTLFPQKIQEK